jgi:hypothetical protein
MKNILLHKLCKWIIASSTGLIAVPVALLAIIVSLNTNIFKDSNKSVVELSRLETHYNLLEEQKQIQKDSLAILHPIKIQKDENKYCHILVIDRTYSTSSTTTENNLSGFKQYVKDAINKDNQNQRKIEIDDIEKLFKKNGWEFSTKNTLTLNFYQSLLDEVRNQENNNTNNFLVCFFDGDKCTYPLDVQNKKEYLSMGGHTWIKTQSNRIDSVENDIIKLAQENLLYPTQKSTEQKSNFEIMFSEINALCNELFHGNHIIVTVISDFDHDFDKKSADEWERIVGTALRREENISRQYNLICYPASATRKNSADILLSIIQKHINGFDNLITIDLNNYGNSKFNEFEKNMFKKRMAACFSPINRHNSIPFHYPKENQQGVKTAKTRIQLPQSGEWRITNYSYNETSETKNYHYLNDKGIITFAKINGGYINSTQDSILIIEIPYNLQTTAEDYKLEFTTNNGETFVSYPIDFKEYMKNQIPNYAIALLDLLCVLIILIVVAGTFLLYENKNNYFDTPINKILYGILIGIIYALLFFIVWNFKYLWLSITSIIICITAIATIYSILTGKQR